MKTIVDKLNEVGFSEVYDLDESHDVNEGVFDKIKEKFKVLFNKVKDWVICTFSDGKAIPAVSPVNAGIAIARGDAGKGTYMAVKGTALARFFNMFKVKSVTGDDIINAWKNEKKSVFEGMEERYNDSALCQRLYETALSLSGDGKYGPDINTEELEFYLRAAMKHPERGVPLLIWGAPGIGKTSIVRSVVKQFYGKETLITKNLAQCQKDDFSLPAFTKDKDGNITGSDEIPKTWLPMYKVTGDPEVDKISDNIANGGTKEGDEGKGGVIFFDEIARCKTDVQAVALSLIEDRQLVGYRLGSKWAIVAASNRECDDPNTDITLSKALGNRFGQVNFVPSMDSWLEWADKQGYMNKDVLNFLKFNQKYWYLCNPDEDEEKVFASPRAWEKCCMTLCNIADGSDEDGYKLEDIPMSLIRNTLLQFVQPNVAAEFMTYYDLMKSVDIDALHNVFSNPKKAPSLLKDKDGKTLRTDIKYYMVNKALAGLDESKMPTPDEMNNFAKWIVTGKDESLVAGALAVLYKMYPDFKFMMGNPQAKDWPKYKDTWDTYLGMTEILIKELPGLDADINIDL